MGTNYIFDAKNGVLECTLYSLKSQDAEKDEYMKEVLNIRKADDEIFGTPIKGVVNFKSMGEISYFIPNEAEIIEKDNFVNSTMVEFGNGLSLVFLIDFDDFKTIYYDYLKEKSV